MTLMKRPVQVSTLVSTVRGGPPRPPAAVRGPRPPGRARAGGGGPPRERERYRVTLSSIGDAVIATDTDGPGDVPQPGGRGADRLAAGRGRGAAA